MTDTAEPCLNNRFIVELGDGDALEEFAEVIFPKAMVVGVTEPLLLSRAVSGDLRLYRWWAAAHETAQSRRALPDNSGPVVPRDVRVVLLSAGALPVMTWRFLAAMPLSLTYSRLDANGSSIVFETIALDFQRLEVM